MIRRVLLLFSLCFLLILQSGTVLYAQDDPATFGNAATNVHLNFRAGPGIGYSRIGTFRYNTRLNLEGRNNSVDWVLVAAADGTRGWVAIGFLTIDAGVSLRDLPVSTETFGVPASSGGSTETSSLNLSSGGGDVYVPKSAEESQLIDRINRTPLLHNMNTSRVAQIYRQGQTLGNRANVFTKTGDSLTNNQAFLWGYGEGNYALGVYGSLQTTIDFFLVAPRDGVANSFVNPSASMASGMNARNVLDPIWAPPGLCLPDETPLACEVRLVKPSVAIIMLGSVDVHYQFYDDYVRNIRTIVDFYVRSGVIPVLTTFRLSPTHSDWVKSLWFNAALIDISNTYQIPLINLWRANETLPDDGVDPDLFHLSQGPNPYHFTGEENQWGVTRRNLLTLQALDQLRRFVLRV